MLKYLRLLLILSLASCTQSKLIFKPEILTRLKKPVLLCRPVTYQISDNVSGFHRVLITLSADYWNSALNQEIFIYDGISTVIPNKARSHLMYYILVGYDSPITPETALLSHTQAARADMYHIFRNKQYCVPGGKIILSNYMYSYDFPTYLTIIRHEFGHSLGLAHSNIKGSLMYKSFSLSLEHPQEATSEVIQYLKNIYDVQLDFNND